ncbi:MAG: lysoplasmalogenase family protein, partial [Gemmatimonadaceae bacterium]
AVGSFFFLASDATLAYARFVAPFTAASFVIMTTYYAAQFGIALSVADERSTA